MWTTLTFHVINCFSCKRDVIQLRMPGEEPRSHVSLPAAALPKPGPSGSCSKGSERGQLQGAPPGTQGPRPSVSTVNWLTADRSDRNIYHFREERADFPGLGWISCPHSLPRQLFIWFCTRSTSSDHGWAVLWQLSHLHSLQPGVRNVFVYFSLLSCHSSAVATDPTPGDGEAVGRFSLPCSLWPHAQGNTAQSQSLLTSDSPRWRSSSSSSSFCPLHPPSPPAQGYQPHQHHSWRCYPTTSLTAQRATESTISSGLF